MSCKYHDLQEKNCLPKGIMKGNFWYMQDILCIVICVYDTHHNQEKVSILELKCPLTISAD